MRRFWLMMMCLVGSLALLMGCKSPEPVPTPTPDAPSLTLATNEVEVSAEGGHYTVGYELLNAVEGAELRISSEHNWVTNLDIEDGVISFDVAASYETEARSCRLELVYPGIYPNPTIRVRQSVGMEHSIGLALASISSTTAAVNVTPKEKNMPYVFILGNGDYILDSELMYDDEALWESDMEIFQSFADAFGSDVSLAVKAFMYEGDLHPHQFTGLTPGTKYVAYAYGFDNETMTPLTEITRLVIETTSVSDYTLNFDFNVEVDGPNVSIDITPEGYDGYYYYGVFWADDVPEGTDPELLRSYCESDWEQLKSLYSSFFDDTEQGLHFVFNELAYRGTTHLDVELDANTEFVLWAFGLNDEALLNTMPDTYYFTTGGVSASDNEFTLSVENVCPRKATVNVATTNDDTYIATLVSASRFEGFTDDEIVQYIIDNFSLNYASGSMSDTVTGLTPSSDYELLVFGCQAGAPTTDLQRLCFTTAETIYADLDFSITIGDYYDGAAVAALDSSYAAFEGSVIVNLTANVDERAVNFYYTAMSSLDYPYYDYETLIEGLVMEGPGDLSGMFAFDYNEPYTFFGVAEDVNGDYTKMWSSKETTFTPAGCSPAEEFFAAIDTLAVTSSVVCGQEPRCSSMLSVE